MLSRELGTHLTGRLLENLVFIELKRGKKDFLFSGKE